MKVYRAIAAAMEAAANCKTFGNHEWLQMHTERAESLVSEYLPSGSGFDAGTQLNMEACKRDRIELTTAFHHMNESGMYDGWTEHKVILTPTFSGFDIRVTGRDRNDIKEYIADAFHAALSQDVRES